MDPTRTAFPYPLRRAEAPDQCSTIPAVFIPAREPLHRKRAYINALWYYRTDFTFLYIGEKRPKQRAPKFVM